MRAEPLRTRSAELAVGLLGLFVLGYYSYRYPITIEQPSLQHLTVPDPGKLLSFARDLGTVLLINAAAWSLGNLFVQRLLGLRDDQLQGLGAVLSIALGLLLLGTAVLGLAAAGLLGIPALMTLLLVAAALRGRALLAAMASRLRAPLGAEPAQRRRGLLLAAATALLLAGPFLEALGPECGWDGLTYHLAIAERYLFHGRVVLSPYSIYFAFPSLMEMLYVPALALGSEVAAKLLHFEYGLLILASVGALAARSSRRCAALAGMFLLAEPLFLQEMGWAYNDLTCACYALLAFGALLSWLDGGRRAWLALAGVCAGGCASTRYLGGAVALSLAVALLLTPGRRTFGQRLAAGLWLGALAAAALLPWLLRNLIMTGNPVSPLLQGLFHHHGREFFAPIAVAQNVAFNAHMGMGRDLLSLLALPWNLVMRNVPGIYTNSFGHQIGPLYLVAVPAALLVRATRNSAETRLALLASLASILLWFFSSQEARFLLPVFPLLSLVGARAFDALMSSRQRASSVSLTLLPLYALLLVQAPHACALPRRYDLALGSASLQEHLQHDPVHEAAERMRRSLKPSDKLLLVSESRSYLFRDLHYVPYQPNEGPPALQLIHRARDAAALRCRLAELGVTHVLFNSNNYWRYPVLFVEGYGAGEFQADMKKVRLLMTRGARTVYQRRGIAVAELTPVDPQTCLR